MLLIVLLAPGTGCCPDTLYEIFSVDPGVRLPQDEAPHCSGSEWWYYSGRLTVDDGRAYGIQAVIFHVPGSLFLLPIESWVAHVAVLDETTGVFAYDQTRSFGPPITYKPDSGGFDLYTPLIEMSGLSGLDHLHAEMADGNVAVDLTLEDRKGVVLHGGDGYVPYGVYGHTFYYSRPRMQASGTLQIDGQVHAVNGTLWFDRQWGRDLTNPWIAWDWFSLRLDNGDDVMVYVFRGEDEPVSFGTYIPIDGDPVSLAAEEIAITATDWWTSPHTGRTYPIRWDIQIPNRQLALEVTAAANDQEFDATATTLNVYWEGLCRISGTHGGQPAAGLAYVELTNYP